LTVTAEGLAPYVGQVTVGAEGDVTADVTMEALPADPPKPSSPWPLAMAAALAVAALAMLAFWYWRRRRGGPEV
jgi:hypothetical protein